MATELLSLQTPITCTRCKSSDHTSLEKQLKGDEELLVWRCRKCQAEGPAAMRGTDPIADRRVTRDRRKKTRNDRRRE